MSHAYYEETIQCPECGYVTNTLCEATSRSSGQKVLMCEGCYEDSDEGEEDWDSTWDDWDDWK